MSTTRWLGPESVTLTTCIGRSLADRICRKTAWGSSSRCAMSAGLPTGHSLRLTAFSSAIAPSGLGIGSPCGSCWGCPRWASSSATCSRLRLCSARSAAWCSFPIGMLASSDRWRSHKRCARTTSKARRSPLSVSAIPAALLSVQPAVRKPATKRNTAAGRSPMVPARDSRVASFERCCQARMCFNASSERDFAR